MITEVPVYMGGELVTDVAFSYVYSKETLSSFANNRTMECSFIC